LTEYHYQFKICDSSKKSPLGRTKTAPTEDDDVSELSFAVFSCSNYREYAGDHRTLHMMLISPSANGHFNAYGNAARKDEHDYVIHLGDYIYETGKGGERATKPSGTIWSLHDYRTRHGQVGTREMNYHSKELLY
jgi:alkaline phosphatase D